MWTGVSNFTSVANHTATEATAFPTFDAHPETAFFDDDLASDVDWMKYSNKGGTLMCGLLGTDRTAGQLLGDMRNPPSAASVWQGDLKQELSAWYWRNVDPTTYSCKIDNHWNFPHTMQTMGLSGGSVSEGGDNMCYRVEHWNPEKAKNRQ